MENKWLRLLNRDLQRKLAKGELFPVVEKDIYDREKLILKDKKGKEIVVRYLDH